MMIYALDHVVSELSGFIDSNGPADDLQNQFAQLTVTDEDDSGTKTKEISGPVLIDKFASKRPAVYPMIAQAVLAPPKPGKAPDPGKFNDNFLKKSSAAAHRPKGKDGDNEIHDDETSKLNVAIPGAKKGRKWSKASRKAIRLRLAHEAKPVKVELMEVDEDGMLIDELAYNLAVTEGEILDHLYAKGIKPDGVQIG
ncbi:hypothetical protein HanXRQr2_Chr01g0024041 [Helianthus annuus]|uniref:Uncharacterized protein n=1 Tax=Helianthus annuus TaxID=4232 RepID=A0A9K3P3L6_HELAN|nr:translation initiation factor IF-2, chloroplastic-like [Helianthus annuus]KAF5822230.1 hypothetical protein HanXRQr2_Chr01g0024041 [Helianthus annuus]